MSRERLLVASAAEVQLREAADLISRAVGNLNTLRFGTAAALRYAEPALSEVQKAHKCVQELLEKIPEATPNVPDTRKR